MNAPHANESVDKAQAARIILRKCLKASLGTIDRRDGSPYVSLVLVATDGAGAPVLLLSKLAEHTKNLNKCTRASLLFDDTGEIDDALTGGRLSVTGRLEMTSAPECARRFLARHEEATLYAEFGDFSYYKLEIERGHYVAGFGAIHGLERDDLIVDEASARALMSDEEGIVAHMNSDHADVVHLMAGTLGGDVELEWRLTGVDREGCDLRAGWRSLRQSFTNPVTDSNEARKAFIELARDARGPG